MPALPPESVIRAACRWLRLLKTSTCAQAWAFVRADSSYTDLTQTQYATALEWLTLMGLVHEKSGDVVLPARLAGWPPHQIHQLLLARALELSVPAWLPDADVLVTDDSEIPQDVAILADELGLAEMVVLSTIREVHGRIDLEHRAAVGRAGELALVGLLESQWPGSTTHVALSDDGFGYDVAFRPEATEWHLEVKSTTRRGRLVLHLSRHEYEVSLRDPNWCLLAIGLSSEQSLGAIATIDHVRLHDRAPTDTHPAASWESVRHQVQPTDLRPGLAFLDIGGSPTSASLPLLVTLGSTAEAFAWMPTNPQLPRGA